MCKSLVLSAALLSLLSVSTARSKKDSFVEYKIRSSKDDFVNAGGFLKSSKFAEHAELTNTPVIGIIS